VLVVVVITLATLLITSPQAASPSSVSGGNPAAHTQSGGGVGSGADAYFGNDSLKEQQVPPVLAAPKEIDDSAIERHARLVAAYNAK
jgi:hypothetical protein